MELPSHYARLYRHWNRHTLPGGPFDGTGMDTEVLEELLSFTKERMRIWERRESGALPPHTADPILATYRFCNVFRELDRQTLAFHERLNPLRDDFPRWLLNMFASRLVARPETMTHMGLLSFDESENAATYQRLMDAPHPRFGTPYVFPVSTIQRSAWPTRERFVTGYLPRVMQAIAEEIGTWQRMSVHDGVARILPLFGFNHAFLWTETLIDVAYQYPNRIDLYARFPVGPGSAPTLHRLAPDLDPSIAVTRLADLPFDSGLTYQGRPLRLSAENWEGMACELRKYANLSAGAGRKRLYTS